MHDVATSGTLPGPWHVIMSAGAKALMELIEQPMIDNTPHLACLPFSFPLSAHLACVLFWMLARLRVLLVHVYAWAFRYAAPPKRWSLLPLPLKVVWTQCGALGDGESFARCEGGIKIRKQSEQRWDRCEEEEECRQWWRVFRCEDEVLMEMRCVNKSKKWERLTHQVNKSKLRAVKYLAQLP